MKKGFSLLEVMVIVAIAAIMVTMGTASLNFFFNRSNMTYQLGLVSNGLATARSMASSRQECVKVTTTASTILAISYAPTADPTCATVSGAQQVTLPVVQLASGFILSTFSNGTNTIIFNTIGGLSVSSVTTFTLTDPTARQITFTIYPAIGQIRASGI